MKPEMKTGSEPKATDPVILFGRDGVIRTLDPLHPMQVRYQAALRPDSAFPSWKARELYTNRLN